MTRMPVLRRLLFHLPCPVRVNRRVGILAFLLIAVPLFIFNIAQYIKWPHCLLFQQNGDCALHWLSEPNETSTEQSAQPSCRPRTSIVFLKTHKTAGSSIQNIFMRYGLKNGLLFALPSRFNYFGHPSVFSTDMVASLRDNRNYDILCHHARLNSREMRKVVHHPLFVTVLRNPVHLFESLYSYYKLNKTFRLDLEAFAAANYSKWWHHSQRLLGKIGRNQMAFDLGLRKERFEDVRFVKTRFIKGIDRLFDLVLIAERMDESLILLKELLCWDYEDIVAFHLNARITGTKANLTAATIKGIKKWNQADVYLYDHFASKLERLVVAFGKSKMADAVERLRSVRQRWFGYCVNDTVPITDVDIKEKTWNNQVMVHRVNAAAADNQTCAQLSSTELEFTKKIRERQHKLTVVDNVRPFYSGSTLATKSFYYLSNLGRGTPVGHLENNMAENVLPNGAGLKNGEARRVKRGLF